jgi:hypothetical protein
LALALPRSEARQRAAAAPQPTPTLGCSLQEVAHITITGALVTTSAPRASPTTPRTLTEWRAATVTPPTRTPPRQAGPIRATVHFAAVLRIASSQTQQREAEGHRLPTMTSSDGKPSKGKRNGRIFDAAAFMRGRMSRRAVGPAFADTIMKARTWLRAYATVLAATMVITYTVLNSIVCRQLSPAAACARPSRGTPRTRQ